MKLNKITVLCIIMLILMMITTLFICALIIQKSFTEWLPKRKAYQIERTLEELDQNIIIVVKDKEIN